MTREVDPLTWNGLHGGVRIESTLEKLRGHLVETPLIGGVDLLGFECPPELRIKTENLQGPGGIWLRGALRELSRHFGSLKGVVVADAVRPTLAAALAAKAQRLPCIAVVGVDDAVQIGDVLRRLGAEVVTVDDARSAVEQPAAIATDRGFALMPDVTGQAYLEGVATVGFELARDLPSGVVEVYVAPARLAAAVELGLSASGRKATVHGVDRAPDAETDRLVAALRRTARLDSDPVAVTALQAAMDGNSPNPCVVLSS